jgi:hemolysin activation/secretion protein
MIHPLLRRQTPFQRQQRSPAGVKFATPLSMAIGLCLASGQPSAFAQSAIDNALRAQERAVREAQERQQPAADVFIKDEAPSGAAPTGETDEKCFGSMRIELVGHTASMGPEPQAIVQAYQATCLSAARVNALLGELNRWYQRAGWITTRVYVSEQKLTSGDLQLRVVPGRIEQYQINQSETDARIQSAFPTHDGLLNLRDLEQGLENINRLPSQQGKFKLYPGKETGSSQVMVNVDDKRRVRLSEMVDNSGTAALGKWKSTTEIAVDNLSQNNDQLAVGYIRNLDHGSLDALFQGGTVNYLIPFGYHLFSASASLMDSRFTLPGINQSYELKTRSAKLGVGYEYLFHRDQQSKQSLIAGLDITRQQTHVLDIEVESQTRRLSVAYLGAKGKHYQGNNVYEWLFRLEQGLSVFNAQETIPDGSNPQYRLGKLRLNGSWPVQDGKAILRSAFQMQIAPSNIPTLAQMYVGGRYDVRGFKENTLYAPSAWHMRNEYETETKRYGDLAVNFYAGLDGGRVQKTSTRQLSQQHLIGAALGVRTDIHGFKLDLAYTRALSRPDEFASEAKGHWFALLSKTF